MTAKKKSTKFQKGNKLAKGGKREGAGRKPDELKALIREELLKHGTSAIEVLVKLMKTSKSEEIRFKAARNLADRAGFRDETALGDTAGTGPVKITVSYENRIRPQRQEQDDAD